MESRDSTLSAIMHMGSPWHNDADNPITWKGTSVHLLPLWCIFRNHRVYCTANVSSRREQRNYLDAALLSTPERLLTIAVQCALTCRNLHLYIPEPQSILHGQCEQPFRRLRATVPVCWAFRFPIIEWRTIRVTFYYRRSNRINHSVLQSVIKFPFILFEI